MRQEIPIPVVLLLVHSYVGKILSRKLQNEQLQVLLDFCVAIAFSNSATRDLPSRALADNATYSPVPIRHLNYAMAVVSVVWHRVLSSGKIKARTQYMSFVTQLMRGNIHSANRF